MEPRLFTLHVRQPHGRHLCPRIPSLLRSGSCLVGPLVIGTFPTAHESRRRSQKIIGREQSGWEEGLGLSYGWGRRTENCLRGMNIGRLPRKFKWCTGEGTINHRVQKSADRGPVLGGSFRRVGRWGSLSHPVVIKLAKKCCSVGKLCLFTVNHVRRYPLQRSMSSS